MSEIFYKYIHPRIFLIKLLGSIFLLTVIQSINFSNENQKYQIIIVFYLIYYLASINRFQINNIFNKGTRRPKPLWIKRSYLINYAFYIIRINFGIQLLMSMFFLFIQQIKGRIDLQNLIIFLTFLAIANFEVIFDGFFKLIFRILSVSLFVGQLYLLSNNNQYCSLIVWSIFFQYIMVTIYFSFPNFLYKKISLLKNNKSKNNFISIQQLILEYIFSNKYLFISVLSLVFIAFHYLKNIKSISLLPPISFLPLMFYLIIDAFIGDKVQDNELDKNRTKFLLTNSSLKISEKYHSSLLYVFVVILTIFTFILFLLEVILDELSIFFFAFVLIVYLLGIIYYRKSEAVILGEGNKMKLTMPVLIIIISFGGMFVRLFV
ncbi:MAG: hypothetical protein LBC17_04095 [Lactobacillaceae bacterium]|jgi:hypothetical protein|nr:hypothetical protein [Lactobacillaceae bacterium]